PALTVFDIPNAATVCIDNFYRNGSLQQIEMPAVTVLEKDTATFTLPSVQSVTVPSDTPFAYYTTMQTAAGVQVITGLYVQKPNFTQQADGTYTDANGNTVTLAAITDVNRAQVFCDFFGVAGITVNGAALTK
ncbi:MAG: hypothetical protein FWF49_03000, partial [Oscillospiraceae bacterium]|nr:hypothetical protein [Oscillospiraceae bacterium]